MTESELRLLIRDAVARHLGGAASDPAPAREAPVGAPPWRQHVSHAIYLTLEGGGDACLIEPAVACHHCAYCQSHGH